jgi:uncharacterized protein (TIGR03546 family)
MARVRATSTRLRSEWKNGLGANPTERYLPSRLPACNTHDMLATLKFLQSLVKTLHSEGTPNQIAAGFALGAALGLTPILNLHNALVLLALALLNVSSGAGLLSMVVFIPFGFMLDPVFDRIGHALLIDAPSLRPLWTALDNTPILALAHLGNTVVLGSLLAWVVLALPIYLLARVGVLRYRSTIAPRIESSRLYHAVVGTQVYNVYRWFQP